MDYERNSAPAPRTASASPISVPTIFISALMEAHLSSSAATAVPPVENAAAHKPPRAQPPQDPYEHAKLPRAIAASWDHGLQRKCREQGRLRRGGLVNASRAGSALPYCRWCSRRCRCRRSIPAARCKNGRKAKLDAALGSRSKNGPWTLHDLRRTAASGMASLGVRIESVEKILIHANGSFRGIVGMYQKHDFASEKRAALDLWGAHVAALPAPDVCLVKGRVG
jgi:hypothetical protein